MGMGSRMSAHFTSIRMNFAPVSVLSVYVCIYVCMHVVCVHILSNDFCILNVRT